MQIEDSRSLYGPRDNVKRYNCCEMGFCRGRLGPKKWWPGNGDRKRLAIMRVAMKLGLLFRQFLEKKCASSTIIEWTANDDSATDSNY